MDLSDVYTVLAIGLVGAIAFFLYVVLKIARS